MQLITIYTFAEATCFIVALYCLRGEGWNTWGLQRVYLAVMLAIELTGTYLRETSINNLPLYNGFIWIECVAISRVLSGLLQLVNNTVVTGVAGIIRRSHLTWADWQPTWYSTCSSNGRWR